jgi:hypothetical protein
MGLPAGFTFVCGALFFVAIEQPPSLWYVHVNCRDNRYADKNGRSGRHTHGDHNGLKLTEAR